MIQQFKIEHQLRERTKCADALAKKGCIQIENFACFTSPPSDVESLWRVDLTSRFYICSVNSYSV